MIAKFWKLKTHWGLYNLTSQISSFIQKRANQSFNRKNTDQIKINNVQSCGWCSELFKENLKQTIVSDKLSPTSFTGFSSLQNVLSLIRQVKHSTHRHSRDQVFKNTDQIKINNVQSCEWCSELFKKNLKQTIMSDKLSPTSFTGFLSLHCSNL